MAKSTVAPSRTVRTYTTKTRADALKAYNASNNAQQAADALHMQGRTFRNIARDLGFGPQKYGTTWDAKSRAKVIADKRIAAHIDRTFAKSSKPRASKDNAPVSTSTTPQNDAQNA